MRLAGTGGAALVRAAVASVSLLAATGPAAAQTGSRDIPTMSLEELMNVEVTSVSKRPERLSDTAASVYVLTNEDIRRSGAATIPDALRLVPGLHVGQIDANGFSVSVRGFGGRFANKLLVLIDGQSVYTPLFSGVFWSAVNVPLEEIERIEIIRGPGATLWGANAVNGVINIITRPATSSQGAAARFETGSATRAEGSLRYGGRLGPRSAYRLDAGGFSRTGATVDGAGVSDTWRGGRVGLRVDGEAGAGHAYMLAGNGVFSRADENWTLPTLQAPYTRRVSDDGSNTSVSLLGRWTHTTDRAQTTVQAIAERTSLHEYPIEERRRTVDLDLQQARKLGAVQQLVFGGTYRQSSDQTTGSPLIGLTPDRRTLRLWSGFAQDEVTLGGGVAHVTFGVKLEHNDYSGWEVQPNIRARFFVSKGHTIWGSVSRAVRLPSRTESDGRIEPLVLPPSAQAPLPQLLSLRHGQDLGAEALIAYEAGYRSQPTANLSIDVSLFLNSYSQLLTNAIGTPGVEFAPVPHVLVPVVFENRGTARMAGGEVVADWKPRDEVRIQAGYSRLAVLEDSRNAPTNTVGPLGDYPGHQIHVRGGAVLFRQVEVDSAARFVGALTMTGVPSYVALDARVGFRLRRVDVSLMGRNLLGPAHGEYLPDVLFSAPTQVQRSIGLRLRWQF